MLSAASGGVRGAGASRDAGADHRGPEPAQSGDPTVAGEMLELATGQVRDRRSPNEVLGPAVMVGTGFRSILLSGRSRSGARG